MGEGAQSKGIQPANSRAKSRDKMIRERKKTEIANLYPVESECVSVSVSVYACILSGDKGTQ